MRWDPRCTGLEPALCESAFELRALGTLSYVWSAEYEDNGGKACVGALGVLEVRDSKAVQLFSCGAQLRSAAAAWTVGLQIDKSLGRVNAKCTRIIGATPQ